jgi:hypothetical protein
MFHENSKNPTLDEWMRTFAIITTSLIRAFQKTS